MNDFTTLYIVRHAEAESNIKGIVGGHGDYRLTPAGEKQAIVLGRKLRDVHFDEVFSSDLVRAAKTAELVMLERQLAVKTTEVLRERNFGDLEGRPHEELFALFNSWKSLSYEERIKRRPAKNAESDEEVVTRFIIFLREIGATYNNKTVLVLTHGGVIHSFLAHLGIFELDKKLGVKNTAYLKIDTDGVEFSVKEMEGIILEDES